MRLIDADNLQFDWCGSEMCGNPCDNCNKRTISKEDIDNAPTIEERPQGKWIETDSGTVCNKCGWGSHIWTYFCPNCGANMRGVRE